MLRHLGLERATTQHPLVAAIDEGGEDRQPLLIQAIVGEIVASNFTKVEGQPAGFKPFLPAARVPIAWDTLATLPPVWRVAWAASATVELDKGRMRRFFSSQLNELKGTSTAYG